jgi:hypothetical protein
MEKMKSFTPCRLSFVFATEVPIAVILRRGPSRWVEIIKWHTKDDQFEHGQWFHGRIYGERCGLSPDGKLFVYFAMKHGVVNNAEGYKQTFTAVSKPPYLTALAMWPEGSTWGGGGRFIDNNTLRLAYGQGGTFHPGMGNTEIYMAPMPNHHPNHPPGNLTIETNLDCYTPDKGFVCRDKQNFTTEWFGRDHDNKEIFIREGKLFRLLEGKEVLVKDFNNNEMKQVKSPQWARIW